jgi:hypothetical protein
MDLGSILLILALIILVGAFISRPLFEHSSSVVSKEERSYSALLAEKDRILNALQEIDFDFSSGKIPEDDYTAQRTHLMQNGVDVLRQMDNFETELSAQNVGDRSEAAVVTRRNSRLPLPTAIAENGGNGKPQDDELEVIIANRRRGRQEKAAGFCPTCGQPVQKSDRFCAKCGATLIEQ